jgi:hypothetical protein
MGVETVSLAGIFTAQTLSSLELSQARSFLSQVGRDFSQYLAIHRANRPARIQRLDADPNLYVSFSACKDTAGVVNALLRNVKADYFFYHNRQLASIVANGEGTLNEQISKHLHHGIHLIPLNSCDSEGQENLMPSSARSLLADSLVMSLGLEKDDRVIALIDPELFLYLGGFQHPNKQLMVLDFILRAVTQTDTTVGCWDNIKVFEVEDVARSERSNRLATYGKTVLLDLYAERLSSASLKTRLIPIVK